MSPFMCMDSRSAEAWLSAQEASTVHTSLTKSHGFTQRAVYGGKSSRNLCTFVSEDFCISVNVKVNV